MTVMGTALLSSVLYAQSGASPTEQTLLQLTNRTRAAHNLPPVQWDAQLARAARAHANRVVGEHGELLHQYSGEPDLTTRGAQTGAHFTTIAENIGSGPDPVLIQQT